jgi:starch synthase
MFRALAADFPGRVGVKVGYDNKIAHLIEAGADIFLMPSRYEPCGLNQIYSLRYGTVPVVRATGGLDDTIENFDLQLGTGTGFKFQEYSGTALLDAILQALHQYSNDGIWKRIQLNGMAKDFSWNKSAAEYARLYELATGARNQTPAITSN